MKKTLIVALLAMLVAGGAYANYCARDVVPASTLLVPYAAVGMTGSAPDPSGATTLLTVTNVSADAQIIHIVVWNAVSEAVLDFDEVLTGYDVWQINFRDMLTGQWGLFDTSRAATWIANINYRTPFEWGPDGRTAYGTGYHSLPTPETTGTTPAAGCSMPYGNGMGVYMGPVITALQAPLYARDHAGCGTQVANLHPNDWLSTLTEEPVFFYVTVDVVNFCNLDFPSTSGFFTADYLRENVLLGDVIYLDATNNFSEAMTAVHIESDVDEALAINFYTEKAAATDLAAVDTEPLATALAYRYGNDAAGSVFGIPITSNVIMWKNFYELKDAAANLDPDGDVDDCGAYLYYAWDENEHVTSRGVICPISPCGSANIDSNEFPFETQSVPLSSDNFDLPGSFGWMLVVFPPSIDFGTSADPTPADSTYLPLQYPDYMAWAALRFQFGTYSAGLEAATMANAHCFPTQILPNMGTNYDYDQAGAAW